ncbi:MAG: GxxExxY protein [Planctomycetota bacterium]
MGLHIPNQLVHSGLTGDIIGAAMEVHSYLGPGFLESVYEESLACEFELRKIRFERQKTFSVFYKGRAVKTFIADFVADNTVIVEIKAIKEIGEIEKLQVINYLKASGLEVGLLFNFGAKSLDYKRLIETNQCNPRNPRL